MKFNLIVIVTSLFFSHLAFAATYGVPDGQQFNLPDTNTIFVPDIEETDSITAPDSEPYNSLMEFELTDTQLKNNQLKQEYLKTLKLLKNKQFDAAESKIDFLIEQNPQVSIFYNIQGLLHSLRKEYQAASKSFLKSIELAPNNLDSHLGLTLVFINTREFERAKKYAQGALAIDATSMHAYVLLAEIAYQEKKLLEVERILLTAQNKARGNSKQEIMIADRLAKLYVTQKKPEKMLKLAEDLAQSYPVDSSTLALLATAQITNNNSDKAIATIKKIIRLDDGNINARLFLAKLLTNQPGNEQQILKLLDEVNSIAPNNSKIQVEITFVLIEIKQFSKALGSSRKVKQLAPDEGWAELLEGEIYIAQKQQDLALTALQNSYKIKPSPRALNLITNIFLAQGKQSEAISMLRQELAKNPKNLTAHLRLGNIYQQQKKNSDAIVHYQAFLAEQPDNAIVLNNLAWIYYLQNNPKALNLAKRSYQSAPKSAAIADTYATILIKQGNLEKGLKISEAAAKLAPQDYNIQYRLAKAYALNDQPKKAVQVLRTITNSEQNFSEKDSALTLLKKLE